MNEASVDPGSGDGLAGQPGAYEGTKVFAHPLHRRWRRMRMGIGAAGAGKVDGRRFVTTPSVASGRARHACPDRRGPRGDRNGAAQAEQTVERGGSRRVSLPAAREAEVLHVLRTARGVDRLQGRQRPPQVPERAGQDPHARKHRDLRPAPARGGGRDQDGPGARLAAVCGERPCRGSTRRTGRPRCRARRRPATAEGRRRPGDHREHQCWR